jgi:tetratricopeptide (TPR) repeat protein
MRLSKFLFVLAPIAVAAVAASCYLYRSYMVPALPPVPLEKMDRPVAELIASAQEEVRQAPRSGAAWGKLAMITGLNGYPEQALACLIQAERFDPTEPQWPYLHAHSLLLDNPRAALPHYQRALELAVTQDQCAAIHFRLAVTMAELGRLDAAEQHLEALRQIEPESARAHFGAALVADARDERQAARQHLEALLGSPFGRRHAHVRLAAIALADGDEELTHGYQRRLGQLPADLPWPDPFLVEMKSFAVGQQSRLQEAESLEAGGRLRESVALLRRIAAEMPDVGSYLALGLGLGKLEAYDEAESVLRAVIDMDPHNFKANHYLGTVLFFKGEKQRASANGEDRAGDLFRQAVAAQDRALATNRDHGLAHLMRGRALAYLGNTDESLRELREAVRCRPDLADTHLYLGEALGEAGQLTKALAHLKDAVRYARPDDPRPRRALEKWQAKSK